MIKFKKYKLNDKDDWKPVQSYEISYHNVLLNGITKCRYK